MIRLSRALMTRMPALVKTVGMAAVLLLSLSVVATSATAKELNLRLSSFALNLDPLRMVDVESRRIGTLLYAPLITIDQDETAHPRLATSWSHKGDTWTFRLKEGLTFSDGTPVRAADVVASLCASMQPSSPWAWALTSIEHTSDGRTTTCSGLAAPTPDTVTITEKHPVLWFLDALASPAGWIISAKDPKAAYGARIGTGPFSVSEITPDSRVVLKARHSGSAVPAGVDRVVFHYLPDEAVAARMFSGGNLDVLALDSPHLLDLLATHTASGLTLKGQGHIEVKHWDRVRIAIVNTKGLAAKGFSPEQIAAFQKRLSRSIDRTTLATKVQVAKPLTVAFPGAPSVASPANGQDSGDVKLPKASLSVITEPDPYSDFVASAIAHDVGPVQISYRGMDKGLLINSIVKGDFDIASVIVEATLRSPAFWTSFFTPGNPYTAFGTGIPEMEKLDLASPGSVAKAAAMIEQEGNWIPLLVETRVQAVRPGITGLRFTPSGQVSYEAVHKD